MRKLILFLSVILITLSAFGQGYEEDWPYGSEVTLIAEPNEGFEFVNWTEDGEVVSTDPVYTFTVTGHRNIIANFARKIFHIEVTVEPEGSGEVTGDGEYPNGEPVVLHGTPNEGYIFEGWAGITEDLITHNPYRFRADNDYQITGVFRFQPAIVWSPYHYILIIGGGILTIFLIFFVRRKRDKRQYEKGN